MKDLPTWMTFTLIKVLKKSHRDNAPPLPDKKRWGERIYNLSINQTTAHGQDYEEIHLLLILDSIKTCVPAHCSSSLTGKEVTDRELQASIKGSWIILWVFMTKIRVERVFRMLPCFVTFVNIRKLWVELSLWMK